MWIAGVSVAAHHRYLTTCGLFTNTPQWPNSAFRKGSGGSICVLHLEQSWDTAHCKLLEHKGSFKQTAFLQNIQAIYICIRGFTLQCGK